MPTTEALLDTWISRTRSSLETLLPEPEGEPRTLLSAMRHAALAPGKRIRPLLVYASGHAFGAPDAMLDAPAVAVELVHTYSLVHDDLPAMDDDALRRGRPTVHIAFGEATAILAGDALQALAFEVLSHSPLAPAVVVRLLHTLAQACGAQGMCGGQALDLAAATPYGGPTAGTRVSGENAEGPDAGLQALERLHALKTGALIRAAVRMGAIAGGADDAGLARFDDVAADLGLAFQIRDDLLDVEGESDRLGKTAGKDHAQGKATFPSLIGIAASRLRLAELATRIENRLAGGPGHLDPLRTIARRAIDRDR